MRLEKKPLVESDFADTDDVQNKDAEQIPTDKSSARKRSVDALSKAAQEEPIDESGSSKVDAGQGNGDISSGVDPADDMRTWPILARPGEEVAADADETSGALQEQRAGKGRRKGKGRAAGLSAMQPHAKGKHRLAMPSMENLDIDAATDEDDINGLSEDTETFSR
jgi:hypothetical protein